MAENEAEREPQPIDEEAVWAAIVAGYGEEPADPAGTKPFKSVEDLAGLEDGVNAAGTQEPGAEKPDSGTGPDSDSDSGPGRPLGSSVVFAPGVGGPRSYSLAEPKDDDLGEDDEGHFVQPDPELPEVDVTARFAWLAVVGGPVLLILAVLLGWDMTWWLATLGIGGFLGGFATLVARMGAEDDDNEDPGRGAVV
ncbi:hypothetical protein OG204_08885 [Streptomyces sp. NBC_01387]|uniref:hypothetical protein n=1 Tax=unclassified Streptomyces TaxID=2593676 RepID=UPI0020258FFA|nr:MULTISPECIES: hypothetical protein [unclassified Streptomyces]MCX4551597.1 hypothetical protein [Streptomyces sp. NBC_01500]WSC22980.1 hypothetical protein OIE60_26735 [Streptomyces sp. NBC_01766]WSV56891.1 hypothetical protein OG282_26160 [Streptomyces sp. NBC_01014]